MNERNQDRVQADGIDERLRFALRGLRQERQPQRDLWPEISTRIGAAPQRLPAAPNRMMPWALAASLLLALGVVWRLQAPVHAPVPAGGLVNREAQAMTREYDAALRELQTSAPVGGDATPALRELDRSAAQIRTALARDPDARFLLERLRHTYSLRLALTQRVALT